MREESMTRQGDPIHFAVTGLGGYSAEICNRLLHEMALTEHKALLRAVYHPEPGRYPQQAEKLRNYGIPIVQRYEDLLQMQDLEYVWLPLPIDQHRQYTEQTLLAGKNVLVEKPAAGSIDDVDCMIAARDRSGLGVLVGYQDVYQPGVQELKRRIVKGEFGIVLSASVLGCWPRPLSYYHRNDWAGKIAREGRWILDSPANNAMAHHLHLGLFLLGATERDSAVPTEVEAELYRANDIENYDTCSLRLTFANGVHMLAGMTHACRTMSNAEIVIRTQYARIRFIHEKQIEIHRNTASEIIPLAPGRISSLLSAVHTLHREGPGSAPASTLEMARAHTLTINAASEASTIMQVPADQIDTIENEPGNPQLAIRDIEAVMEASIREDRMLHELGAVKWSAPAGDFTVADYRHFAGPKR
jgi:predicted dehydrogenase